VSDSRLIMVIEDDDDIREVLAQILEEEGYTVALARHGGEALAALRSGGPLPSVIFLDLMMPVMDGFEFCAEKQRDQALAPVPVVVMSADGRAEPKLEHSGVQGYLRKPLTIRAILDTAAHYFD
jgi:CheY-like chemotaxis protein